MKTSKPLFQETSDIKRINCAGTYFIDCTGQLYNKYGQTMKGSVNNKGYLQLGVNHNGKQVTKLLVHRVVYETFVGPIPTGLQIDHIDHNPLNNSLSNIRVVTHSVNALNKSSSKGVYKNRGNTFSASVCLNKKSHYLGSFTTYDEAHEAYNVARNLLIKTELARL